MRRMKPLRTFAILAVLGLVLAMAGTALAQSGEERRTTAQERRAELQAARQAILDTFHEARRTILADYHEAINATRTAYLAHKADVLAACNATRAESTGNADNESGMPEHAKCVSDGLQPYIQEARAANAAARDDARAKLVEARAHGMSEWAKALRDANERHRGAGA